MVIDRANTDPVKPIVGTICSALVENEQEQILVCETEHGISMLGGYVDWSKGFPKCLEDRIAEKHGADIKPRGIRGVYQNHTPGGSWITNINVVASCESRRDMTGCFWANKHDILKGEYELRTPDIKLAILRRMQGSPLVGFDFVTVTGEYSKPTKEKTIAKTVSSMVIQNPIDHKFLLMRCGRDESAPGKLSLIGGAEEFGERKRNGTRREAREEASIHQPYEGGLVGAYINKLPGGHQVANIATFVYCYPDEPLKILTGFEREVEELLWLGIDELDAKDPNTFRTIDTYLAIKHAAWLKNHSGFFDDSLVKRVSYELPGLE